jgi:hypothetical protein
MHDIRVRLLPRKEDDKPLVLPVRDELCERPPRVGDRLNLTMMAGLVAGVEFLKPRNAQANEGSPDEAGSPRRRRQA